MKKKSNLIIPPAVLQLLWGICFLGGGIKQYFWPGQLYYEDILLVSFKSLFMAQPFFVLLVQLELFYRGYLEISI